PERALFPYPTLFRSRVFAAPPATIACLAMTEPSAASRDFFRGRQGSTRFAPSSRRDQQPRAKPDHSLRPFPNETRSCREPLGKVDRKSTRLNSSHVK